MAVDKEFLEKCILEAAGDDAEMATFLRERYAKNEAAAARFTGGYMRTADYTRKTQELAGQRTQFEQQSGQLETTRKALEAAEIEKSKIMRELAGNRISTAKASELLKFMAEKYTLTDEDVPGISDLIATRKTGTVVDSTEDIEKRWADREAALEARLEKKFAGAMIPELGAMASLPIIWQNIADEHFELTGKRLSFAEQQEILKAARAENKPLRDVWEEKFQIGGDSGLRMKKRDETLKSSWQAEREKEEADKRSKQALEVVTPTQADLGNGPGISPAFKTRFRTFEMDPQKPATPAADGVPSLKVEPGQHVRQSGDRGPSAAQRAAAKYLERQASGGYGKKVA